MNMKNKIIAGIACLTAAVLTACSEVEPTAFEDTTGIYFNNRSSAGELTDSTDVTFIYESADEMTVPVKVQLLGRPSATPRPVAITVTSDDAVEGIDYTLPASAELPAGASDFYYNITLKRTAALKQRRKSLLLTLAANADFSLPFTSEVNAAGDTITSLAYRIWFSDIFTKAPSEWQTDLLGTFSQQKFELICKVIDNVEPADFNNGEKMTLAMQAFIHTEMTRYVKTQQEKKAAGESYDADAFDDKGNALEF